MSLDLLPPWYLWIFSSIVIPFVTERLTSYDMKRWKKSLIEFGVCVAFSLGSTALAGEFHPINIVATLGSIFTTAQLLYDNFFKDSIKQRQLERATPEEE